MWSANARWTRRCCARLGLLAIVLQLLAGAVPMQAFAAPGDTAWIGDSVCLAGDDEPYGADPVCPVCFVLCQAATLPAAPMAGIGRTLAPAELVPVAERASPPAPAGPLAARGPPVPV